MLLPIKEANVGEMLESTIISIIDFCKNNLETWHTKRLTRATDWIKSYPYWKTKDIVTGFSSEVEKLCINYIFPFPYMQNPLFFYLLNYCRLTFKFLMHQLCHQENDCYIGSYTSSKLDLLFISSTVSHGAQEIFKLLPHTFVDPSKLPEICGKVGSRYLFTYPIDILLLWFMVHSGTWIL